MELLPMQTKPKYVQTFGYERKDGKLIYKNINFNRAVLEASEFHQLINHYPAGEVADLITNYTILVLYKRHYVQVTGPSLP
jgi:hypothetical protein